MDSSLVTDSEQTKFHNNPVDTQNYVKRFTARKNLRLRDNVVYDVEKEQKEGMIVSFNSNNVQVLQKDTEHIDTRNIEDLYKKDELLKVGHWDHISNAARTELLKSINVAPIYYIKSWLGLPHNLRTLLLKEGEAQTQPYGVASRNVGSKNEKTKPGNDTINETDPSPVEHKIETKHKQDE